MPNDFTAVQDENMTYYFTNDYHFTEKNANPIHFDLTF